MSTTSSSRKRPTSSRKTPNPKSNIISRRNVLQILNFSSDDDEYNNDVKNKTDNSNDKTNDNSNDATNDNDNDDEDFNEENEHECKVASQIGTQDLLDYPNLHHAITLPEHSSPFLRCLEAYKEENSKEFIEQLFA